MRRSWSGAFVRVLAGAVLLGLVQGLLQLPGAGAVLRAEVLMACVAGAALAALLAWPMILLLSRLREPAQAPRDGTAFWIGWGLGLTPVVHNFAFRDAAAGLLLQLAAVAAVLALMMAAAPRLGERFSPPRPLLLLILAAGAVSYPSGLLLYGSTAPSTAQAPAAEACVDRVDQHTVLGWLLPRSTVAALLRADRRSAEQESL